MQYTKFVIVLMSAVLGGTTIIAEYSGKGGMLAYEIKSKVYEYHYKNGFTGVDAMGWDANLQYAWSRVGAALTCNIEFNKELIIENMSEEYGVDPFWHDLNGIGFHHVQSKNIEDFCTKERVSEISKVVPKFEVGDFPQEP